MRGRKPADPELKVLCGVRSDRIETGTPVAPEGEPQCPTDLDADARAEWERICEEMKQLRTLSESYRAILTLYCETYSRWVKAKAAVRKHGLVVETETGTVKPNPAATIADRAERAMVKLLGELGLTPESLRRSRANAQEKSEDKLTEFLARRKRPS